MHPNDYPPSHFPDVAQARYSRLGPVATGCYDEAKLKDLANLMHEDDNPVQPTAVVDTMPSGFVYFGQFVDHDLTRDLTPVNKATPHPETTRNYRNPRLDLEILYGKGPEEFPELYVDGERLRLGMSEEKDKLDCDLWRDPEGYAVVIDPRSDENLLIAQMHVLWARLHNYLLDLMAEQPDILAGIPEGTPFERTRCLVTWIYQWIVVYDFLPFCVLNEVWEDVFCRRHLLLYDQIARPSATPFALPIEFTVAAFRFGHSMVRRNYILTSDVLVPSQSAADIIAITKAGGRISQRLKSDYVVDWRFFLDELNRTTNRAARTDTFISPGLYTIKSPTKALFTAPQRTTRQFHKDYRDHVSVPCLTLTRGSNMLLASGEQFCQAFDIPPVTSSIHATDRLTELFSQPPFQGRTPLWYYILREADLCKHLEPVRRRQPSSRSEAILKLGTAGSRIVSETFFQLLQSDPNSILNAGRHWIAPSFCFKNESVPDQPDSLWKVATLVD